MEETKQRQNVVSKVNWHRYLLTCRLDANIHFIVGWMRDGVSHKRHTGAEAQNQESRFGSW